MCCSGDTTFADGDRETRKASRKKNHPNGTKKGPLLSKRPFRGNPEASCVRPGSLCRRRELRVSTRARHVDVDLSVADVGREFLPFCPVLANRQLDLVFDHPLEKSCAVGEAVAVGHELFDRLWSDFQCPAATRERALDLCHLLERDRSHFVLGERAEDHHLVDAVAELRREPSLELPRDLSLHLFDANLLREEA